MTDNKERESEGWGDSCGVIDVGAAVLGFHESDGVLYVTTTKGTFPLDKRLFDEGLDRARLNPARMGE